MFESLRIKTESFPDASVHIDSKVESSKAVIQSSDLNLLLAEHILTG